jgi:1-phosphatidylinositol-4-phosphate 5-kinase
MNPFNEKNKKAIQKSGEGMGKSGSFFFFSHDKKLLIKTMTTGDFEAFMKLFRDYFYHINDYPQSLLARVYGIY